MLKCKAQGFHHIIQGAVPKPQGFPLHVGLCVPPAFDVLRSQLRHDLREQRVVEDAFRSASRFVGVYLNLVLAFTSVIARIAAMFALSTLPPEPVSSENVTLLAGALVKAALTVTFLVEPT